MGDLTTLGRKIPGLLDERDLQRQVDRVIEHHVNELEKQAGPDDEFVSYMQATRRTALILPFEQNHGQSS